MSHPYTVNFCTASQVLALYAGLFVVIRMGRPGIAPDERKTALVVGGLWFVLVFIANILLARAGVMSPLPLLNNFMHTGLWIGICLTALYFGNRHTVGILPLCIAFAVFSLVVKYAENHLFGTWDLDHFFYVFRGNPAYILGWSLADGLYPVITLIGVRLISRFVSGLVPS
jgi:hypothetical protein